MALAGAAPVATTNGTISAWHGDDHFSYLREPVVIPRLSRVNRVAMRATIVAAVAYGIFILHPGNRGELLPYVALVVAESVLLLNAVAMWWTTLSHDDAIPESETVWRYRQELLHGTVAPSVDVLVTVYGEPLALIEQTVRAARDMRVPHATWVCDDGRDDAVMDLCDRLGVGYFRRDDRRGAKAGNANRALARTSGEFIAIFDADHAPHPDFLLTMLPHLAEPDVAFVQAPQAYRNENGRFVENANAESQRIFYELICPGKNRFNAAFHVGTNAVFRRSALLSVDGFYEDTHSEDIWTSIRIHQQGWRSVYLPHILARGIAPDTVNAHLRQQFRWASGSFEILFRSNPLQAAGLSPRQRVQYFTPPLHFLLGFANLWFLTLPALFLLFGITPVAVDSGTWLTRFLPFYLLTQAVLWLQAGGLKINPIILSVATAPAHVHAFFAVLLRRKPTWRATNEKTTPPSIVETMLPQLTLLLLNLTAIVVGLAVITNPTGTAIAVTLCTIHIAILGRVLHQAATDRRHTTHPSTTHPATIDLRDHPTPARRGPEPVTATPETTVVAAKGP